MPADVVPTFEIRLIEPNGHTACVAHRVAVEDVSATVEAFRRSAISQAAEWAEFGFRAEDYRVTTLNEQECPLRPVTVPAVRRALEPFLA